MSVRMKVVIRALAVSVGQSIFSPFAIGFIATEGSQGVQGGVTGSQGQSLTKSNHDTLDLRKPNILSCVLKVIVE